MVGYGFDFYDVYLKFKIGFIFIWKFFQTKQIIFLINIV